MTDQVYVVNQATSYSNNIQFTVALDRNDPEVQFNLRDDILMHYWQLQSVDGTSIRKYVLNNIFVALKVLGLKIDRYARLYLPDEYDNIHATLTELMEQSGHLNFDHGFSYNQTYVGITTTVSSPDFYMFSKWDQFLQDFMQKLEF